MLKFNAVSQKKLKESKEHSKEIKLRKIIKMVVILLKVVQEKRKVVVVIDIILVT